MASLARDLLGDRRRLVPLLLFLALLLLPPLCDWLDERFYITLTSRILIWALAAMSLDLILGFGGMASLGHASLVGIGAYVVAILAFHGGEGSAMPFLPFGIGGTNEALIAWPAAIIVSALFALVIGALSLRTTSVYFIMITLAFGQMLFYFFVSLAAYGGEDGLSLEARNSLFGFELDDKTVFYYACLAMLAGFFLVSRRVVNSRFGLIVRGAKDNEARVRALGYSAYWYKLALFVIAGAGAGLAGALAANQSEFVDPGLLHWSKSGEIMVMVILGGMGTLVGPIFGAALLLFMEEWLSAVTEHWMIFLGPILVVIVLFARRGLYGWLLGAAAGTGHGKGRAR